MLIEEPRVYSHRPVRPIMPPTESHLHADASAKARKGAQLTERLEVLDLCGHKTRLFLDNRLGCEVKCEWW
jgi:hypothetical protein